jgi:hypothetical protein
MGWIRDSEKTFNPNQLMSPKYLCRFLFDILSLLIADGGALAAQHLPRPGGTVQECYYGTS